MFYCKNTTIDPIIRFDTAWSCSKDVSMRSGVLMRSEQFTLVSLYMNPYEGAWRNDPRRLYMIARLSIHGWVVYRLNKTAGYVPIYLAWLRLNEEFPVRVVSPTKLDERETSFLLFRRHSIHLPSLLVRDEVSGAAVAEFCRTICTTISSM